VSTGIMSTPRPCKPNVPTGVIELTDRYYTAAYPSIDRHVYAETLPSSDNLADFKPNPIAITDSANPGYFEVSFSPGARYYVLSYRGPKVPWQRMVEATDVEGSGIDFLLEGNQKLNDTLAEFMAPLVTRSTFEHDGIGQSFSPLPNHG